MTTSKFATFLGILLMTSVVAATPAAATDSADKDALQAVLLESKEKNRGVTIHANGSNISMVVVAVDERYVIGRSQQTSRIVIRLDRIDGVSAMF